ncbi:MAG: efflux RND transporter periplasmic adaptor subunit [Gammaproteobacteria bacterium]|nr:efflux RND transporter periplasmic adaptor subunit [Gammaproteobacteria bacterium]
MIKKLLPVFVLGGMIALAALFMLNRPETTRLAGPPPAGIAVETLTVTPTDYQIILQSYGTVRPRTENTLFAQVAGQITAVSPNFRAGGFFEKDEVLLRVDPRDYEASASSARANLVATVQALQEEEAQAEQVLQDWQRLGDGEPASPLALRKPQLEAARAAVDSARAALKRAELDLERTQVRAPYAGRVLQATVDAGQIINTSTELAQIYAVDVVEIRLPVNNRDLAYIRLPESYRHDANTATDLPEVTFTSRLVGEQRWTGRIVRTEGAIDTGTQQLYIVARIDDPYGRKAHGRQPLKINEYVTAAIKGDIVPGALVIPNSAIYQGSYVYVAEDGVLRRRDIRIAWQNDNEAIIDKGLTAGDALVQTPLGQVITGTPAILAGKTNAVASGPDPERMKTP